MEQRILLSLVSILLYATSALTGLIQKCTKVVDIAVVLDESGSIGFKNFQKIKGFVDDVITRFSVHRFGAHFAAVKYSTRPSEVFSLTKYTNAAQLQTAVQNMKYQGGGTYTGKAMRYVEQNIFGQALDRKNAPNVLVLFSDGESSDHSAAVRAARRLKRKGVAILCVGIGNGVTINKLMWQLRQLASKPKYVFKTTMNALNTIENELVKDICEAIPACKSQPCQNGGQCVETDTKYQCICSPQWTGVNCEIPAFCPTASFSKQGCFKTPRLRPTSTTKLLFSQRNNIDWGAGWDDYLDGIVCDCGKAAKAQGYKYFLIAFYGECWGYKDFDVNKPRAGAKKCWGKRPNYDTCDENQKIPICVGTGNHGYLYQLN